MTGRSGERASFQFWDVDSRKWTVVSSLLVEEDFVHVWITALTYIVSKQPTRWLFLFTKLWLPWKIFFIRILLKYAKLICVLLRIPPFPNKVLIAMIFRHAFFLLKIWRIRWIFKVRPSYRLFEILVNVTSQDVFRRNCRNSFERICSSWVRVRLWWSWSFHRSWSFRLRAQLFLLLIRDKIAKHFTYYALTFLFLLLLLFSQVHLLVTWFLRILRATWVVLSH